MDKKNLYKMMIESLRLIAAKAEVQVKSFPPNVVIPDEIALTFDDIFLLIKQEKESLNVKVPIFQKLEKIDRYLDVLSDENPEFWTIKAMKNDVRWDILRSMGAEILKLLNEENEKPNLYWLWYITNE